MSFLYKCTIEVFAIYQERSDVNIIYRPKNTAFLFHFCFLCNSNKFRIIFSTHPTVSKKLIFRCFFIVFSRILSFWYFYPAFIYFFTILSFCSISKNPSVSPTKKCKKEGCASSAPPKSSNYIPYSINAKIRLRFHPRLPSR